MIKKTESFVVNSTCGCLSEKKCEPLERCPTQLKLLVPNGFVINLDERNKTEILKILRSNIEPAILCTSGATPAKFGLIPSFIADNTYDRLGGPTEIITSRRVSEVLPAPIAFLESDFPELYLDQDDLPKIYKHLNKRISTGQITAYAAKGLACSFNGVKKERRHRSEWPSLNSCTNRSNKPSIGIVTRTMGNRVKYLIQNFESVQALKRSMERVSTQHLLIGDVEDLPLGELDVLRIQVQKGPEDNRLNLVRTALNSLDTDYVLFLDDDDFLLDSLGSELQRLLDFENNFEPIILPTRHFHERENGGKIRPGKLFSTENLIKSFGGPNETPFPSVIYPRVKLINRISKMDLETSLLEDQLILMAYLGQGSTRPWHISVEAVGIRIHGKQTVSNFESQQWQMSMADIAQQLASIYFEDSTILETAAILRSKGNQKRAILKILKLVCNSRSWVLIRDFRILHRLWTRQMTIRELIAKVSDLNV